MHPSHARVIVACPGRRVLRSVLRPVHVNPRSNMPPGNRVHGEAFVSASRLGKLTQVGGTNTGVGWADVARLAPCHRSCKGEGVACRRKGRRSRPPSLRGNESSGWLVARRVSLQKSAGDAWPRISSANALQKERQGRVNGGLARSGGWRVKPSAFASREREVASRPHRYVGRGSAQGPRWRESVTSGGDIVTSGASVAGPGL